MNKFIMIDQRSLAIDAEDCFDEFISDSNQQEIYQNNKQVYYEENWSDDETNDDFLDRVKRAMI